jgi:hypothetical protein
MNGIKFLIIFFLFSSNAFAYLDPGSGSILVQGLVAILATITFHLRVILSFKDFFFKK